MKCEQLGYMHIFNNETIYRQPKKKEEQNSQDRSAVEENETSVQQLTQKAAR